MVRYYVDLGLSVKWATCNLGAEFPHECGDYFTWGDISPKASENTSHAETLHDISGDPDYDAARANWGGSWRTPTADEMIELIRNCNWIWTTKWGQKGYKVKSKKNGNSIFLPAVDWFNEYEIQPGIYGNYWTSTPEPFPYSKTPLACVLQFSPPQRREYTFFYDIPHELVYHHRGNGYNIRPVID